MRHKMKIIYLLNSDLGKGLPVKLTKLLLVYAMVNAPEHHMVQIHNFPAGKR